MKKKQLSTEEAKRIAKIRWDKTSSKKRSKIAKRMNKIRWGKQKATPSTA